MTCQQPHCHYFYLHHPWCSFCASSPPDTYQEPPEILLTYSTHDALFYLKHRDIFFSYISLTHFSLTVPISFYPPVTPLITFREVNFFDNPPFSLLSYNPCTAPSCPIYLSAFSSPSPFWLDIRHSFHFTNCIIRRTDTNKEKFHYSLTWSCEFPHENDTCYFAHCYPYTYSDLQVKPLTTFLNEANPHYCARASTMNFHTMRYNLT